MSNNKLYMAAVCLALLLLVFFFSRTPAQQRIQAVLGGSQAPRARLAPVPGNAARGGTRVAVTTEGQGTARSVAAIHSAPADSEASESVLATPDAVLPTAEDMQNPQQVLDAMLADGSIPTEEGPRVQRLVHGLAHQIPLELLRDKPRMREMLRSYVLGPDPQSNDNTGGSGTGSGEDSFPANPYESVFDSPVLAGEGPSEKERQQSLDQYLAITAANNPSE